MLIPISIPAARKQTIVTVGNNLSPMMEREGGLEGRVFLVIEEVVAGLYPEIKLSRPASTLIIPSRGESLKTMETMCYILAWLRRQDVRRQDRIMVVGGGALLDVASLAASLFKRGLPTILVPTTVVGQVDAAVGGKCAINFGGIKNNVGQFHFPLRVYCATEVLSTLPLRHFWAGLGEVWKYCMLWGLESLPREASRPGTEKFAALVARCIQFKAKLVEEDPWDWNKRRWLNMGHTLGHALEAADRNMLHGEAVLWGLEFALRVSINRNLFNSCRGNRIIANLRSHPRPSLPNTSFLRMLQTMGGDKKNNSQLITMVLPGDENPVVAPCSFRQLFAAWHAL